MPHEQSEALLTTADYRHLVESLPNLAVFRFDRELLVTFASGSALTDNGYIPSQLVGGLMTDILPVAVRNTLESSYMAAITGHSADFVYTSPVVGRRFQVTVRPTYSSNGDVTGGMAIARDVSADSARVVQLEQLRHLLQVGTAWFDRRSGWTFDPEFLEMLGLSNAAAHDPALVAQVIAPEAQEDVVTTWRVLMEHGGERTTAHAIRRGGTGELRHLRGRWLADVEDGELLRAILTHTDVTDEINARLAADQAALVIAGQRSREAVKTAGLERDTVATRLALLTAKQRDLLEQLANTETRERVLLAEAVHDDPLQLIIAAILRIDNLKIRLPESADDPLEQVAGMLVTAVDKLRQLIVALSPPDLTAGLGMALRLLGEGIFVGTTTSMQLLGPAHVPLTIAAKEVAYRIMREAMINARKHAGAAHVLLAVEERPAEVVLTLTDDGVGADSLVAGPGHVGIATMRTRAEADGGGLLIHSRRGQGTMVELRMPRTVATG